MLDRVLLCIMQNLLDVLMLEVKIWAEVREHFEIDLPLILPFKYDKDLPIKFPAAAEVENDSCANLYVFIY